MFVITSSQVFLGMKFSNAVKQKTCLSRRDSVLLNRLRIGYTRLTHSFLLSGDDLPECRTCQCPLTVKDILVECVDDLIRSTHSPESRKECVKRV